MQILQEVLFRQHCKQHASTHKGQLKYRTKAKKEPHQEDSNLPAYILQKFHHEKVSPAKHSNRTFFRQTQSNNQIFMHRDQVTKYRKTLSPLRAHKNLREYSNLLFVKKNEAEIKLPNDKHFQTLHYKNNQPQKSSLDVYNNRGQNKPSKEPQQNSSNLQISHLPIIAKQKNLRKQHQQALKLQLLTASNLDFHYRANGRNSQIENVHEAMKICGWEEDQLLQ